MSNHKQHPASYRDPAGFVVEQDGRFYRQVNQVYAHNYDLLLTSGLYDELVKTKRILSHTEIDENITGDSQWHKTLLPKQLGFISYPYEWCFSQWKDAALLTLDLVKKAIDHGMILKDATPFNIQFVDGTPTLIDSLSFEKYDARKPWVAYRQFTECFLGPLLLARYHSAEMLKVFQLYPEGIPLRLVAKMLPIKSLFNTNVFLHVRLPVMFSGGNGSPAKEVVFSRQKLLNIINNLHGFTSRMPLPETASTWDNYYNETILSQAYATAKMNIIEKWLQETAGKTVLDIGANTGMFSTAAAAAGKYTVAVDADIACVENMYAHCTRDKINNLLPLCIDITNPSPGIGWNNTERAAFFKRGRADIVMALALVHHLVLTKNIPLAFIAASLSALSSDYIFIEFVPLEDEKAARLALGKNNAHPAYGIGIFEESFITCFTIEEKIPVPNSSRVLYKLKKSIAT